MVELRLASIQGGQWFDSLSDKTSSIQIPKESFGLTTDQAIKERLKTVKTSLELKSSSIEGLVLALRGPIFDKEYLISALHAAACGALAGRTGGDENASVLDKILRGRQSLVAIPECFKKAGVVSCMSGAQARGFAEWIKSINMACLEREIADMHGVQEVQHYLSVLDTFRRVCDDGTSIHKCDVCVMADSKT